MGTIQLKPYQFKKGFTPWNKGNHIYLGGKRFEKGNKKSPKAYSFKKGNKVNLGRPSGNRGKKLSGILLEKVKQNGLKGLLKQQTMKEPTSIEKKVYEELKVRGILFEKQRLINGKFLVDAYIPSLNLVIEADGDYWHSLDRVKKRDKAKNAYLTKCGYNLLRLTETEINNGLFKERLGF